MPGVGGKGKGRGKGSGTPRVRKSRKKNEDVPQMIFPPQLQETIHVPPIEESGDISDNTHYPPPSNQVDGQERVESEVDNDDPPVLEPCNVPPIADNSVFNFTEDEEPPPPLHGDGLKKSKTPR